MTGSERPPLHEPVMLQETMTALALAPGGRFVDGTLGTGGYAAMILEATAPDGQLLALDWDDQALALARQRLGEARGRLRYARAGFAELPTLLAELGWEQGVDGLVLDLGLSSAQLDSEERGFAFSVDGPLDMRMDRRLRRCAADLANELPEADLADLIYRFGEEPKSYRVAKAIVAMRAIAPLRTTGDLREAVHRAGLRGRRGHDPCTRTFQAFRIAVNGELEQLEAFLNRGWELLRPGGRMAILSYHSLEDRLVKNAFRTWAADCLCPPRQPLCCCGWTSKVRLVGRRQVASASETERNRRARSAGLRVVERRPPEQSDG
ncbi:MAG: 16S rRNA (cytosine(1402)-N(4))-methyltransferase RsmH [Candidatus Binatia bacterium]